MIKTNGNYTPIKLKPCLIDFSKIDDEIVAILDKEEVTFKEWMALRSYSSPPETPREMYDDLREHFRQGIFDNLQKTAVPRAMRLIKENYLN